MTKKEIKREVVDYIYVANDGTEFKSEDECRKYDESAKGVMKAMFDGLLIDKKKRCVDSFLSNSGADLCWDDVIKIVEIKNLTDLEIVNRILPTSSGLGTDFIGKTIAFEEGYDGELYYLGTKESMMSIYSAALDGLFEKEVKENN